MGQGVIFKYMNLHAFSCVITHHQMFISLQLGLKFEGKIWTNPNVGLKM